MPRVHATEPLAACCAPPTFAIRYADADAVAALAPKLAGLVRRGTGLNTRAGAGRFITSVRAVLS